MSVFKNYILISTLILLSISCTRESEGEIVNRYNSPISIDIYSNKKILYKKFTIDPGGSLLIVENHTEINSIIETLPDGTACHIGKSSFRIGLRWRVVNIFGKRFWSFSLKGCKGDGGVLIKR